MSDARQLSGIVRRIVPNIDHFRAHIRSLFEPFSATMPALARRSIMRIGVPKEIKNHEYRVGMTPAAVREAVHHGHQVLVQAGAGAGIGCDDASYAQAGASVLADAAAVFAAAEMIVKVKEPQPAECAMLREGQLLFTYLHLAPDPVQAEGLLKSGCTAIAYETITDDRGGLPLLAPMSEVAGRMAIQVGAVALQKAYGGRGVLLGGVPGSPGAGGRDRRRRGRHACRAHGRRPGCRCHDSRPFAAAAAPTRRAVRRPREDAVCDARRHRSRRARGRPRRWRRAGARCRRAEADQARATCRA